MNTPLKILFVALAVAGSSAIVSAQELLLKGRSALEINVGIWGMAKASNTITLTGVQSEAKTSGFAGGLLYSHWVREQYAVTLSAGVLAGESSSRVGILGVNQQASSVVPVLIGLKYYIPHPEPDEMVRLFLSAAVGTYIGSDATNTTLSQEAHSETAFGGRFGVGLDFFLSNHFKLGANVAYNLMSDFKNPVGARTNYNGSDFSLGVGYIF